MRVIYVEDNIEVREAMISLMELSKMEVLAFDSAESAIASLRDGTTADVLLSDNDLLGRLTGVDLISWVKHHIELPCMMLSGDDDRRLRYLLEDKGVTDVTVFTKGRTRPKEVLEAMRMIA